MGRSLPPSGNDNNIWLRDVVQRQQVAILKGHTGWVVGVAFSPDGTLEPCQRREDWETKRHGRDEGGEVPYVER
jgi:WD40 repeat protein